MSLFFLAIAVSHPARFAVQELTLLHLQKMPSLGTKNMHVFWNFNWDFQDSFTPKAISIDDKDKIAFIEFKDENRRTNFAQFDYTAKGWQFVEIIDN